MSSTILVLGASGFIGRHLAETFAEDGHLVIAATRRQAFFNHLRIESVVSNFTECADFLPLVRRSNTIIHAASESTPGSSLAQPQLDGNLRTTLAMIEALQHSTHARLLYLSSGGTIYGDRAEPARENDSLRPRSYHGAGKAAAEQFIHAWTAQYAGIAIAFRPSNVYGPGQAARPAFGVIPSAFKCALRGEPFPIWGDGSAVRDYLYIDDFIALCRSAMLHSFNPGMHVFNAASNEGTALDTLLDKIDAITGCPLQRNYQPTRISDIRCIVMDNTAARGTFDWCPSIPLITGLKRTWQWYSNQT